MISQAYGPSRAANDNRAFLLFFALSTICHVVFFGLLIVVPNFNMERKSTLSVINVSMVTLPAAEKLPEPARQTPAEVQKLKSTPTKTAEVQQKPTISSRRKVKKSLKKETFKPSKMVKRAITRMEKKVEEARPDQVSQAIGRLKENVKRTDVVKKAKPDAAKGPAIPGGSEADSKRVLELIDIYRIDVAVQIQKNWAFSERLAGGRTDLVAEVAFTIMPDGEIKDVWFDKRSGNGYLDESARKAILKSNPVRPHPQGVKRPYVIVGLRFTPKGVR